MGDGDGRMNDDPGTSPVGDGALPIPSPGAPDSMWWTPVGVAKPHDDGRVLVAFTDGTWGTDVWDAWMGAWDDHDGRFITHWSPPPRLPTAGECNHRANARLIAAESDHALVAWAMCVQDGRWEEWPNGKGEFCYAGLRHCTSLDAFGVPILTPHLRALLKSGRDEWAGRAGRG